MLSQVRCSFSGALGALLGRLPSHKADSSLEGWRRMAAHWPVSTVAKARRVQERWRFTRVGAHSTLETAKCAAYLVRKANGQGTAKDDCDDPTDLEQLSPSSGRCGTPCGYSDAPGNWCFLEEIGELESRTTNRHHGLNQRHLFLDDASILSQTLSWLCV